MYYLLFTDYFILGSWFCCGSDSHRSARSSVGGCSKTRRGICKMYRGKKIINERDGQLQAINASDQTVYFIRAKHSGKTQRS